MFSQLIFYQLKIMTSTKEYYDVHVLGKDDTPNWNDMMETSSVASTKDIDTALRPGNLTKWTWRNIDGKLPSHVAKRIYEKGIYFSTTQNLVNPYTGQLLGVKGSQRDNPYYLVVSNYGQGPAYYATTCPQEYVAIMKAYSPSFVEKSGGYKNWEERVTAYNKKFPNNKF